MCTLKEQYTHYWHLLAVNPEASITGHACKALEILDALARDNQLKEFGEEIQKRAVRVANGDTVGGNCHDVTAALLNDLDDADALSGWLECKADVDFAGKSDYIEHSWVEFDGYAIDNADGKCTALPVLAYEAAARMRNPKKCT
jgi:hypothetical protein